MKKYRISDLISSPLKVRTKDYAKVNHIFILYLNEWYETMCKEIYWYKDFIFFQDLNIYLCNNFKDDNFRRFYYRDINEIYNANINETWQEVKRKKIRSYQSY